MKKFLKGAVYVVGVFAIYIAVVAAIILSTHPTPQDLKDYSVRIDIGDSGHGSGVLIGKDTILTAAHVVDGKVEDLKIVTSMGKKLPVVSVIKFEGTDLAVVKTGFDVSDKYAEVSCVDPKYGEDISVVGNPLDMEFTYTEGVVSGKYNLEKYTKAFGNLWLTDAAIAPGNSGGPVFNTKGEVMGVVSILKPMLLAGTYPTISGFGGFTSTKAYCDMIGE